MCCENHSTGNHIQNPKNNTKPTRICNLPDLQLYSVLVFDWEYQFHPRQLSSMERKKGWNFIRGEYREPLSRNRK